MAKSSRAKTGSVKPRAKARGSSSLGKSSSDESRRKPSVKDQIYKRLRMEIISFGLRPGERISESQLAERFDVGIASIRAVLPKLVQEGFVLNRHRLGHVIRPITVQDMLEVFQLRLLLEPEAAELATGKVDLAELEAIDARSAVPLDKTNQVAEVNSLFANRDFHVAIAHASGNKRLSDWVGQLQDFSIRFQYILSHSGRSSSEWDDSHEPLLLAFRESKPSKAREAMRSHIERGRELLLRALVDLPEIQELNIGKLTLDRD